MDSGKMWMTLNMPAVSSDKAFANVKFLHQNSLFSWITVLEIQPLLPHQKAKNLDPTKVEVPLNLNYHWFWY